MHLLAVFAASALADVIPIEVGTIDVTGVGRPRFNPDTIHADVGDILEFRWVHGTHDVTLSHFDTPCKPYIGDAAAFYSGMATGGVREEVCRSSLLPYLLNYRICHLTENE